MQKVAVLITCHNRKDKTLACLSSFYNAIKPEKYLFELFLVDDGSTDGTCNVINQKFPKVNVIIGTGDLFWNRGMHLAWKTASNKNNYDFYLWLNDDTLINESGLVVLLQTSLQKGHESIIVGTTSAIDNKEQTTYGGRTNSKGLITPKNITIECDYFNGNIVLIPNAVYKKVGTNDSFFRHSLGDFDYALRASKLNVKSYIAPGYLGRCDQNEIIPTWRNPNKSFKVRWEAFRSPLGNNPEEFFVYKNRHSGLIKAIFYYFTNHIRVIMPSLWKN